MSIENRDNSVVLAETRFGNQGTGSGGGGMEQRIRNLEENVSVIKATMATSKDVSDLRADVHSLLRQNIMWSVGTIIAASGLVFAIVQFAAPA